MILDVEGFDLGPELENYLRQLFRVFTIYKYHGTQ